MPKDGGGCHVIRSVTSGDKRCKHTPLKLDPVGEYSGPYRGLWVT